MLEAIYLILDVVLASVVAALLLRFRTQESVAQAAERMRRNHRRFALGATVLAGAGALLIPGTILPGKAAPATLHLTTVGAYLLALAGVILIASTTWAPPHGAPGAPAGAAEGET